MPESASLLEHDVVIAYTTLTFYDDTSSGDAESLWWYANNTGCRDKFVTISIRPNPDQCRSGINGRRQDQ
jgi:hypothetical protein